MLHIQHMDPGDTIPNSSEASNSRHVVMAVWGYLRDVRHQIHTSGLPM